MLPPEKHGLNYATPARTWDEGLPLANGLLGALVWGDGQPLNISLDRTDLWDLRPVPEFHSPEYSYAQVRRRHEEGRHDDLLRLLEDPYRRAAPTKIPAGRLELSFAGHFAGSTLDLARAVAEVEFEDGVRARIWTHAQQPVGVMSLRGVDAPAFSLRLRAPDFAGAAPDTTDGGISVGSLGQLGYAPPQEYSGEGFRAFEQTGWDDFRFAVYCGWRAKGDGVLAAWAIATSAESSEVLDLARRRVETALAAAESALLEAHTAWWRDYWAQSSISLPDEVLERQWFLESYKFGAAARRGHPPITLQGPWTADDGGLPPWKGDYHHDLNTQLSYWPCYSGNRLDEGLGFLDWLWETRANCRDWTQRFFALPGLNVPMTADLNNDQIGGWRQYTHSATTAAWLSHHFYLHWKYSADREFLQTRAYPYLRESAVFLEAITQERDARGLRALPLSSSPEIHDNRPEAWFSSLTNYDLALSRWLFAASAELAGELGEVAEAARWRSVLDELPDFALGEDGRLLVAPGEPLGASHRHFSHLMALHPLGLISPLDEAGRRIASASLAELEALGTSQWCGYSFAWLGNLLARTGDGEGAARALRIFATAFTLRNGFHCNGDQSGENYSDFTYRPFTLEGNFACAAGIQEMLLQSWGGVLRIFPALPDDWHEVEFSNLRAEGAFVVSARMRDGRVENVEITAERGGPLRLLSPFDDRLLEYSLRPGESLKLTGRR
jgi:alpha-L-fucosidase 2